MHEQLSIAQFGMTTGRARQRAVVLQVRREVALQELPVEDWHHALPLPVGAFPRPSCMAPALYAAMHVRLPSTSSQQYPLLESLLLIHTATSEAVSEQEAAALHPNPLAPLHAHRKVMAVIGIYYCPSIPDVARAYSAFELQCKCVARQFL